MVDIISGKSFCIILGAVFVIFLFCLILYLVLLKKELQKIQKELEHTREQNYNRQLTVSLLDKDLTNLATELNKNLDYQKELKLKQEQAEKTLKQSISDIAHDLRTPLTVVKGNLQMIEKNESLSPGALAYLRICQEKSDVLKTMVDEFFELSVLESEQTEVLLGKVDVTKLLMEFLIEHEAVIREHGLQPDIRLPQKSIYIHADEEMLKRMFSNLLNNIVKYAKDSFLISLEEEEYKESGKETGTVCKIIFTNELLDNRDLKVEHLFDRTYRGDKARTGTGAGLGLYIVKLLAQKQGAKVYAQKNNNFLSMVIEFYV